MDDFNIATDIINKHKALGTKLILAFQGDANSELLLQVMRQVEHKLEKCEQSLRLRKKIFNILVEVLQNIFHYYEETGSDTFNRSVFISLNKNKSGYCICTCNQVQNDQVLSLKLLLDKTNALNKDQLVDLYREKLVSGEVANTGRAGLGILDIKRKAGTNFRYGFDVVNNQYTYFSLIVSVIA